MSRTLTQRRAWLAVVAALAVFLSVMVAWRTAPGAEAASGRRLCMYIEKAPTEVNVPSRTKKDTYNTVAADLYVAINYKKDGACPELESTYFIGGDATKPVRFSYMQPVPKVVCEDWYRTMGVTGNYLGTISSADPPLEIQRDNPELTEVCPRLAKNTIFEFYVIVGNHYFADGSVYTQGDFVSNKRWDVRGG